MIKVLQLKDIDVGEKVFVVSPMHPDVISPIDLSKVDKKYQKHIGTQLRRWLKKGVLYTKNEQTQQKTNPQEQ